MAKKHIITSLTMLIILLLNGSLVFYGEAAPMTHREPSSMIDAVVWEAIAASPTREATVVVSLKPEGGDGPELAIDAQFRLEKALDLLTETGVLRDVQVFYGANIIKLTGGLGVLRLLEDWPDLESVSLYESEESWELQAQSNLSSELTNASGLMIGRVTAANGGTPLAGIRVTAYRLVAGVSWEVAGMTLTDESGDYAISSLSTGIYRARFDDQAGNYATQFYNNKPSFTLADNFDVTDGQVTPNINATMALAGKISGTVIKAEGGGLKDIAVSAWTNIGGSWQFVSNAITAANGTYTIGSLPPGTYRVRFADVYTPPSYLVQWYDGQLVVEDAQDINVSAGTTIPGINAAMGSYGSITGNVKAEDGTTNLAGINVDAFRYRGTYWEWISYAETDSSGNYEVNGLSSDKYRLEFSDPQNQFQGAFYNNKPDLESADDIEVVLGFATSNIDTQLLLKANIVTNSLAVGWNLISLPVIVDPPSTPYVFESIDGNYSEIWAYDACDDSTEKWKLFNPDEDPDHPINTLETVDVKMGYWVNLSSSDTLYLDGIHPLSTSINLCPGWNLIGYPSLAIRPVEEALESISGTYTLVRQYRTGESSPWKTYNPELPPTLNTLNNMESGYGYWIYMTEAATLVINGR